MSRMASAIRALDACAFDLEELPPERGLNLLTAAKLKRLAKELSEFGARDLLTYD